MSVLLALCLGLGHRVFHKSLIMKLQTHCERSGQSKQRGSGVKSLEEGRVLTRSSPEPELEQWELHLAVSPDQQVHTAAVWRKDCKA